MKKAFETIRNKDSSISLLPNDKSCFSLIWLHGLGDSSEGFYDYFLDKHSPLHNGARVHLLQAPNRPVTCNGGMKFNSWYDIKSFSFTSLKDEDLYNVEEINESIKIIDSYVQQEFKFWREKFNQESQEQTYKRIFVGGFSQGCAMSLVYSLTRDFILGGEVGFSGHVFTSFDLKNKDKLPMLIYHGKNDAVINFEMAKMGYDSVIGQRPNFTFKPIEFLEHTVTIDQLSWSTKWMLNNLKENKIDIS